MAKSIFLTGTGTDIGKTYLAGLITKKLQESGHRTAYYKAAMSGNDRRPDGSLIPGDALHVREISGISQPLADMCPYVYELAYSPHLASRIEGNPVDLERVAEGFQSLCSSYDYITVEGSGGILCPIRYEEEAPPIFLENVIRRLNLTSLLVADAGLGTINSVVLTVAYMRSRGLPLAGILFNHWLPGDVMQEDNKSMCEALTGLPVLACVEDGATDLDMDITDLAALYR